VPHLQYGVGAVATQALINPFYGVNGLRLLRDGKPAADVVATLIAADDGRDHRQLHVMDASGRVAAHTGAACVDWCGHRASDRRSLAGNMLAGPSVLEATEEAYAANASLPFARRLIAAMRAGEAAGGDKRGKQSAALLVHDAEDYPIYDLRVDDHADPLSEIARLHQVAQARFVHFRRSMPSRRNPSGLADRSGLEELITRSIAEGYE
jgi:uncharacterized Ntn-hydrolase superfamily protein